MNKTITPPFGRDPNLIETTSSYIWISEEGILYHQAKDVHHCDVDMALEDKGIYLRVIPEVSNELSGLIDLRSVRSVSRDARLVYMSTAPMFKKIALLVKSPLSRIVGSLLINIKKPDAPIRLFSDVEKAHEWLKDLGT